MKHDKLIKLILAALFAALTCVATSVIHVPIPATNGYINLGDGMVLLGAFLLGPVYGAAAGGLGSMLEPLPIRSPTTSLEEQPITSRSPAFSPAASSSSSRA